MRRGPAPLRRERGAENEPDARTLGVGLSHVATLKRMAEKRSSVVFLIKRNRCGHEKAMGRRSTVPGPPIF